MIKLSLSLSKTRSDEHLIISLTDSSIPTIEPKTRSREVKTRNLKMKLTLINLPKRDELTFLNVFAFPKASSKGLL